MKALEDTISRTVNTVSMGYEVVKRLVHPKMSSLKLSLTYDCDQRCKTCNIWTVNRSNPKLKEQEIVLEEVKRFAEVNKGLLLVSLTGGEPILRKDLKFVLEVVGNMLGLRTLGMTTNGSQPEKLKEDLVYALDHNRNKNLLLVVQVSFEGPESLHDEITRSPGSFRRAKASLEVVRALEKKYPQQLRSRVNFTLSKFNPGSLEACLVDLNGSCPSLDRVGLEAAVNLDKLYFMKNMDVAPTISEIKSEARWLRQHQPLKAWLDPVSLFTTELPLRQREKGIISMSVCSALKSNCNIDPYWGLHPCGGLTDVFVGNLRDFDYSIEKAAKATESIWMPQVKEYFSCGFCKSNCDNWGNILSKPWKLL